MILKVPQSNRHLKSHAKIQQKYQPWVLSTPTLVEITSCPGLLEVQGSIYHLRSNFEEMSFSLLWKGACEGVMSLQEVLPMLLAVQFRLWIVTGRSRL